MTEELKRAIEDLYSTFDKYLLKSHTDGCPCCVSDSDKERTHSKQLRKLEADDLSRYTFKAMTTWGNVEDFKHYLPRIFELLSTTDFSVDTFVVLGKLEYGKWRTWNENEQEAVKDFLLAWWSDLIRTKSYFDKEAFIEIYKLTGSVEEILERWTLKFSNNSFSNYVDFVQYYYVDLLNRRKGFEELNTQEVDKIIIWTRNNSGIFETGFFHFDQIDKDMAERISNTQYIYEQIK